MKPVFHSVILIFFSLTLQKADAIRDCKKECVNRDPTDRSFKPQECFDKCQLKIMDDDEDSDLLEVMVGDVATLKILVIVLLVIFIMMFLFVVMILTRNLLLCPTVELLKNRHKKEVELEKGKDTISVIEASRIGNYSGSNSPYRPQRTSSVNGNHATSVYTMNETGQRKRTPSESTCPDESQLEGYDNLGLSSVTLNYHSRPGSPITSIPSSPSSQNPEGGSLSMGALNTTMTTIRLDSSIPEIVLNPNSNLST